jgi:hypothetical protein
MNAQSGIVEMRCPVFTWDETYPGPKREDAFSARQGFSFPLS